MDKALTLINDPQVKAVNSLTGIWGVGMSTAAKLYNWGVTSPEALWKDREVIGALNAAQLIGLKHVEDFKRKIPRAEVELILERVKETVDHLGRGKLTCRACGSYRRGKVKFSVATMTFTVLQILTLSARCRAHLVTSTF